jgi:hypothetical protein
MDKKLLMPKMNTTFIITGGAGRVVCAIPALEKYARLNPNDNFNIIVNGWESLFWSHPVLQNKTIGANQKNTFESLIKQTQVCIPEPYQVYGFYNQQSHLVEAFDQEINHTTDHSDLNYNCLYLSEVEREGAKELIEKYKSEKKKTRTIIFQPYGSGIDIINKKPLDRSNRSLTQEHTLKLIQEMSKDAIVLNASKPEYRNRADTFSIQFDDPNTNYFRRLMGLIYHCDYYVGVCSVGQHIARAFNKKGLIIMGATHESNYSYPNHFDIYRKPNRIPIYSPWRLSDVDIEFSDRSNDGIMDFTNDEMAKIISIIKNNNGIVESPSQSTGMQYQ